MDLIVRGARLPDGRTADIGIQDGVIAQVEAALGAAARQEIAADGRLTLPAFVNPHLHACKSFWREELARLPEGVRALHRFEALAHVKRAYTPESVLARAERLVRLAVQSGTGALRLFADVDEGAGLRAWAGLRQLKAKYPFVTIQLVPFPQNGFARCEGNRELLAEAVAMGADAVGAVPWLEPTEADGRAHAEFCLDLAMRHGLPLHAVADDTENPESRSGALLAELALRHRWPLLLTQLGSLGFQDDGVAAETIQLIRQAGATVISNGHIELITCGATRQPRPRGNTRVRELLDAGVRVLVAQDDVDNPYYPFGRNDPLDVALLAAHAVPLAWDGDLDTLRHMVTNWAAEATGLQGYGLAVGCRADLTVLDAPSWQDALQFQPARHAVVLGGRLRAQERREVNLFLDP